jgi:hypothetical protein
MRQITKIGRIGLDLAKNAFGGQGVDAEDKPSQREASHRDAVPQTARQKPFGGAIPRDRSVSQVFRHSVAPPHR